MVCGNFGILIAFIVGHYLDFIPVAAVHIAFPALFAITFLFFPDTPYHFINFNQEKVKNLNKKKNQFTLLQNASYIGS